MLKSILLSWEKTEHNHKEVSEVEMVLGLDRITADPDILGGKACIRGMRISVSLVVNLVANGMTTQEIITAYPYLEPEDIRQALRYAAWTADDTIYRAAGAVA